jgi:hypothetical protein
MNPKKLKLKKTYKTTKKRIKKLTKKMHSLHGGMDNTFTNISSKTTTNLLSNLSCQEVINTISTNKSQIQNAVHVNWSLLLSQLLEKMKISSVSNDVNILVDCGILCKTIQKQEFTKYYNICKIITLANKYGVERTEPFTIDSSFITRIMMNTIPRISDRQDQDFLHTVFPFTEIPESAFSIFNIFRRNELRNPFSKNNTKLYNILALRNITIPNSVTHIGDGAFYGNKIVNVFIPYSVTHIGKETFRANQIDSLIFEENELKDEDYENIIIEKKEKTLNIDDNAFYDNRIETLHLPSNIIAIGSYAFAYNEIDDLNFQFYSSRNPNLVSIGDNAFYYNRITSLKLPTSLYEIGEYAFFNNYLEEVTIPESVKEIGEYAFANTSGLTLYFPKRYEKNKEKIYDSVIKGKYVSENMKIEFKPY